MNIVVKFIFNFCNFSVIICLLNQITNTRFLFPTVVNAVFVAKLLILGILPSISAILAS